MKKLGIFLLTLCFCVTALSSQSVVITQDADSPSMQNPALPATAAQVGDPYAWLDFDIVNGSSVYSVPKDRTLPIPAGLESMYRWMEGNADTDTVVYTQMPAGRVLAYASLSFVGSPLSAADLCALWPQIAAELGKSALFINDAFDCTSIVTWRGEDWAAVKTTAALDGDTMLSIDMLGFFNCDSGVLREVWLIQPSPTTYLYDASAKAELQADVDASEVWVQTLRFLSQEEAELWNQDRNNPPPPVVSEFPAFKAMPPQPGSPTPPRAPDIVLPAISPSRTTVEYTDPLGRFTLTMPDNVTIILPEDVDARLQTAQADVGDLPRLPLYRHWLEEAKVNEGILFVSPGYDCALMVMFTSAGRLKTAADVAGLASSLEKTLSQTLTDLSLLDADLYTISNLDTYVFAYNCMMGAQELSLLIFASVEDGVLREANLWNAETGVEAVWPQALLEMMDSIAYPKEAPLP